MLQQYGLQGGSYTQQEMLEFDQDKLVNAERKLNSKHPFEREVAIAEVQILTRNIKERVLLINS